jgi:pimeloyl-ACP methyl ester carboxylesterase
MIGQATGPSNKADTKKPVKRPPAFLKWALRIWITLGVAALLGIVVGYQTIDVDERVFSSDAEVSVVRDGRQLTFAPRHRTSSTALLFLPGAMVDPAAYAPMARKIAAKGYRVTLLSLPLRMAPTDASVAGVMQEMRNIVTSDTHTRHWVVAGHSRGGKLAANFAHTHPALLSGLLLVATSHPDQQCDLTGLPIPVTKVYGTRDGVALPEAIAANATFLPAQTTWVRIAGANHAQFAHYRFQLGDHSASIDRREQQRLLVDVILRQLSSISGS